MDEVVEENMTVKINKIIKHILLAGLIVSVITAAAVVGINLYVKTAVSELIVPPEDILQGKKYDCIMVLGCGVYSDGTPSPMLSDRLDRAIELYNSGAAPKIIMTGDHGRKEYDEVNIMRKYAIERGVPEDDVFMDHAGFSTYESVYRAKEIFCVTDMIIVTQKYHLYRALYISDRLGMNAIGVNSDYRKYYGQKGRDIREVAARCKDFFKCIVKPEPTFLGDTIPVSGSGTATLD